jgi:hypothetical protein
MILHHLVRWIVLALVAIAILAIGIWCSLAIWFRCGIGGQVHGVLAALMLILTLFAAGCLATAWRWPVVSVYAVVVVGVLAWWSTIMPSNNRDWAPDVARSLTGVIEGNRLVVSNVRNFTWRSDTDFDQRWEQRIYDLSHLHDVDLILSYWAGEAIAHLMVSFGFDDGTRLDFSIETRKESGEPYSAIAGFFKQYELVIVAADERDVVRVRSNVRGEDVRIYRLRMQPADARALVHTYIEEANNLARTPRWYNTLTSNCTTLVFGLIRTIRPGLPLDYRVLLSGYLPNYAYDLGATDTSMPFAALRKLSHIRNMAAQADTDPNFSARIRDGLPVPH